MYDVFERLRGVVYDWMGNPVVKIFFSYDDELNFIEKDINFLKDKFHFKKGKYLIFFEKNNINIYFAKNRLRECVNYTHTGMVNCINDTYAEIKSGGEYEVKNDNIIFYYDYLDSYFSGNKQILDFFANDLKKVFTTVKVVEKWEGFKVI